MALPARRIVVDKEAGFVLGALDPEMREIMKVLRRESHAAKRTAVTTG